LDKDAPGFFLYLFGLCLPVSMFCWTVAILALGFPRDPGDRSRVFRLAARVGMVPDDRVGRMLFAAIGLGLMNAAQVIFLLKPPPGNLSAVVVVYFLAQGICLALIAWVAFHPRSGDRSDMPPQ
jgi:hypothetical protein